MGDAERGEPAVGSGGGDMLECPGVCGEHCALTKGWSHASATEVPPPELLEKSLSRLQLKTRTQERELYSTQAQR